MRRRYIGLAVIGALLAGGVLMIGGDSGTDVEVIRDVPDNVTAGEAFEVDIHIRVSDATTMELNERTVDSLRLINGSRTFSGDVEDNHTLSYYAYLPMETDGRISFNGTYSTDGKQHQIGGDWWTTVSEPASVMRLTGPSTTNSSSFSLALIKTVTAPLRGTSVTVESTVGQAQPAQIETDLSTGTGPVRNITVSVPEEQDAEVEVSGIATSAFGTYPVQPLTITYDAPSQSGGGGGG